MFEYHGWAVVRDDAYECDDERLRRTVAQLGAHIANRSDASGLWNLRWVNGEAHLLVDGFPNRRHDDVLKIFEAVAYEAPGSYGLLYVRDDESEHDNEFRVWRLARGRLEVRGDPFLSPCVPIVEDPEDEAREA